MGQQEKAETLHHPNSTEEVQCDLYGEAVTDTK